MHRVVAIYVIVFEIFLAFICRVVILTVLSHP